VFCSQSQGQKFKPNGAPLHNIDIIALSSHQTPTAAILHHFTKTSYHPPYFNTQKVSLSTQKKSYYQNVAMNPSGRDTDANDEKRTIGRKRPYQPSDEATGRYEEETSQSEGDDAGESSSARWSSNHASLPDSNALQEGYDAARGGGARVHHPGSEARASAPALDSLIVGGNMTNPSFLVSASNSDANHNNSITSDTSSFAARPATNNPFQAPILPVFNPFAINQASAVLNPAFSAGMAANAAANQANASAELMNLYQQNLMQLMNNQSAFQAQQASMNPGISQLMAQQQFFNPFFTDNPYTRLLYQQALASNMANDAQRLQLAGLMSGGASAASLPFAGFMGADTAAASRGATSLAALQGLTSSVNRQPLQPTEGPILYMSSDEDILSDQQCLLRKQIELFPADTEDVNAVTPGRRKDILLGQVGIRCVWCAHIPIHQRSKGSVYYPAKLKGIYQAAQNMSVSHFCDSCENIDPFVKAELRAFQHGKSTSGHGGKQYWADSARVLGVMETEEGLRFDPKRKYTKKTGKAEEKA